MFQKNNLQGSNISPHSVHDHSGHEKRILCLIFSSVFVYPSEASFIRNRMADRACGRQLMTHNDRLINKLMCVIGKVFFLFQNTLPETCPSLSFLLCWGYVYKAEERYFHSHFIFEGCPSILNKHDTWHI